MPSTITRTYTQVEEDCCSCGITFTMPEWLYQRARNNSDVYFYCPQGHSQHYSKSELDKLRERLKQAEAGATHAQDQRAVAERRVSAMKGQVTKLKKRTANGVCPCCNRSFVQLKRHMDSQHPDYAEASE